MIKDKREETSVAKPNQSSNDSNPDLHVHLLSQDKKVSSQKFCDAKSDATNDGIMLTENHITQFNDTVADDRAEDKGREAPHPVSEVPGDNDPKNNVSSADLVEVKEESTEVDKRLKKYCSESDVSSEKLLYQTASGNQSSQALQASSKENDSYSQGKCEVEPEELKPLSPTSVPLKSRESTCPDSGPMMSQEECGTIPESCKSNSRPVVGGHTANQDNSASPQDSESAQINVETNNPSSARHQDHGARRPLLPPQVSRNRGGKWHQMRNAGKFCRSPKYGNRGYTNRKQHQQQRLSSQQFHPAEGGAQMPVTQVHPSQSVSQVQQCSQGQSQFQATANPTDFVAAHSWPIPNIQIQNSLSQCPPPATNTTSQVLQHAMQGNGQYGYVQNSQEYNQIWQYYYYQQQLQLQQHYIQLQQQSFQQEQSQQLKYQTDQSQMGHLQPQQLQQLQLQHQVLQQQQPQLQEHPVYLQQLQPSTQVQCVEIIGFR